MNKVVVVLPSAPKALQHLNNLYNEIDQAPSIMEVEAMADQAAGYQRMFKPIKDVSDRAGEVWIKADVRIGAELLKLPRATGTQGRVTGPGRGKKNGAAVVAPPFSQAPTLKELGMKNTKRAASTKKLASLGDEKREELIVKLKEDGKAVTPNAVLAAARVEVKKEKRQAAANAVFSEAGPFDVVVIDPPWPMQKIDRDERPNQAEFDYDVMSIEDLQKFWPDKIAPHIQNNCHLLCWTTQKFLPAALQLIEKWGFNYILTMVWHKPGGFQPIDLPQYNCEFCVYARKGAPIFIDTKSFSTCNDWPRREHSRKPAAFYELIARVTGGSRLDVFAREAHEGFAQYGKEIAKFNNGDA